jgi:hypothetical protein
MKNTKLKLKLKQGAMGRTYITQFPNAQNSRLEILGCYFYIYIKKIYKTTKNAVYIHIFRMKHNAYNMQNTSELVG